MNRTLLGPDEIIAHPFFKDIDFKKLLRKEIEAEYKPELKDLYDVKHFDDEFTQ